MTHKDGKSVEHSIKLTWKKPENSKHFSLIWGLHSLLGQTVRFDIHHPEKDEHLLPSQLTQEGEKKVQTIIPALYLRKRVVQMVFEQHSEGPLFDLFIDFFFRRSEHRIV